MPDPTREEMIEALRIEIMILEAKVTTGPQHLAALRAALRELEAGGWPRYRHKKRGTTYQVIGEANSQVVGEPIGEGDVVIVYRADSDGSLWIRRKDEFHDGRFELLLAPPATSDGGEG